MNLKSLKTYFNIALLGYYPETEINSFFFMLTESILGLKRIDVSLSYEDSIKGENYNSFQLAVERLQKYEPIQYLIGDTEFYGLNLNVNASVLIPRPETEELVSWILEDIKSQNLNSEPLSILDIGTGSGGIAIALAKNMSHAKIFALDVSKEALKVAKSNASLNNVDITFLEENILDWCADNLNFDIIVSNPPYVRESEKNMMSINVLNHEPHLALFVKDDDALLFYRKITQISKQLLNDNGSLYFEINEYLGENMQHLMEEVGFKQIELKQDLFEKDRMIKGVKL